MGNFNFWFGLAFFFLPSTTARTLENVKSTANREQSMTSRDRSPAISGPLKISRFHEHRPKSSRPFIFDFWGRVALFRIETSPEDFEDKKKLIFLSVAVEKESRFFNPFDRRKGLVSGEILAFSTAKVVLRVIIGRKRKLSNSTFDYSKKARETEAS